MTPNDPRNAAWHIEIQNTQVFMQAPYICLRERGWSREEAIKILHTALKVALADEATKKGGIDNEI